MLGQLAIVAALAVAGLAWGAVTIALGESRYSPLADPRAEGVWMYATGVLVATFLLGTVSAVRSGRA